MFCNTRREKKARKEGKESERIQFDSEEANKMADLMIEEEPEIYNSAQSEAKRLGISVEDILDNTEHRDYKRMPIVDWELAIIKSRK